MMGDIGQGVLSRGLLFLAGFGRGVIGQGVIGLMPTTSCYGVCLCTSSLTKPNPSSSGWTSLSVSYRACLFHLRRIRLLCSTIDSASFKTLIHCLILTRLDCCNSVLYHGLQESTLLPLTRIFRQAARLCLGLSCRNHVTRALCALQ